MGVVSFLGRVIPPHTKIDARKKHCSWLRRSVTSLMGGLCLVQMILKKYPEIKKLMGYDPTIAIYVSIEVLANVAISYLLRSASWWVILPMAWVVSATLNHSLGGAIHEIGHNLAFGHTRPLANRALGMLANLPMAIPLSVTYKKYHSDHHRYLG